MPKSGKQKTTACMVLAMREGKLDKKKFPTVAKMMTSMSTADLKSYCQSEVEK